MASTQNWRSRVIKEHGHAYTQVEWRENDDSIKETALRLGMTVDRYKNAQASVMADFNEYLRQNVILVQVGQLDEVYGQFVAQIQAHQ
ncbi:MAG: hypothetical protein IPP74_10470 [Alphaproteobacteria bacterium]|nr:hypothetical protein [Alphaproteobacteria bacterium]